MTLLSHSAPHDAAPLDAAPLDAAPRCLPSPVAGTHSLATVLAQLAATDGGRPALTFVDHSNSIDGHAVTLSRRELDARVEAVAVRLAEHARPGDRAAVLLGQSVDWVVTFLAAIRAGLFAVPIVAGVADVLRERIADIGANPLQVQRSGTCDEPPLWLLHPAGGPTSVYHDLVRRLDGDYAVYGPNRLDGGAADVAPELWPVEARARRYAELIREVAPHGPYRLAGWSFGGVLARETARCLTAVGETVEVVVMLGTALYVSAGNGRRGPFDGPLTLDLLEGPAQTSARSFVAKAAAAGVPVTADLYGDGTHSWPYWERALHRSWPVLAEAMGLPPVVTRAPTG